VLKNVVLGWREPRRRRGRWAKPSLRGCESVPRTKGSRGREGAQPPAEGGQVTPFGGHLNRVARSAFKALAMLALDHKNALFFRPYKSTIYGA